MHWDFHRVHPRGVLFNTIEWTVLSTGAVLAALVTVLVLFLGVYFHVV